MRNDHQFAGPRKHGLSDAELKRWYSRLDNLMRARGMLTPEQRKERNAREKDSKNPIA